MGLAAGGLANSLTLASPAIKIARMSEPAEPVSDPLAEPKAHASAKKRWYLVFFQSGARDDHRGIMNRACVDLVQRQLTDLGPSRADNEIDVWLESPGGDANAAYGSCLRRMKKIPSGCLSTRSLSTWLNITRHTTSSSAATKPNHSDFQSRRRNATMRGRLLGQFMRGSVLARFAERMLALTTISSYIPKKTFKNSRKNTKVARRMRSIRVAEPPNQGANHENDHPSTQRPEKAHPSGV